MHTKEKSATMRPAKKGVLAAVIVLSVALLGSAVSAQGAQKTNGEFNGRIDAGAQREMQKLAKPSISPVVSPVATPKASKDRIIVKFKKNTDAAKKNAVLGKDRVKNRKNISQIGVDIVTLEEGETAAEAVERIKSENGDAIESIEVDQKFAPAFIPNDPLFQSSWSWYFKNMNVIGTWDMTMGNASTSIAIIDTGVDCDHPDLAGQCLPGWNTFDENSNADDVWGHGTQVAGTAAMLLNNNEGGSGVCPNCKIVPIRVSDVDGYAYASDMIEGLVWAADNGIKVANFSFIIWGSPSIINDGAQYFYNSGGLLVTAAGNNGWSFPTASSSPYFMVASATNSDDTVASWSNTGGMISLAAPGNPIRVPANGGGYTANFGTSFASPMIAATAALILSVDPNLTQVQVRDILQNTATDIETAGWDMKSGYGRVNPYKAVKYALGQSPDTTAPTMPTLGLSANGNSVTLTMSGSTDNVGVVGYPILLYGAPLALSTTTSYVHGDLADGAYFYSVAALDAGGNLSSYTNYYSINVDTTAPVMGTSTATTTGPTQVNVTWSAATDNIGVTGYKVYRNNVMIATTTALSYLNSGLTQGTYGYKVSAYDAAGNQSGTSATTTIIINDTTNPSTPTGLVGTIVFPLPSRINLSWTASTDNVGVTGYKVYRNNVYIASTSTNAYFDLGLIPGTYTYKVSAYDAAGNNSASSSQISKTVPFSIMSYSATPGQTTATVAWITNASTTGVVNYGTSQGNLNQSKSSNTSKKNHSVNLTNLQRNRTYYYRITATASSVSTTTPISSFMTN